MRSPLFVGLLSGLAFGLLYFLPLPGFIAGLGWGPASAAAAAGVAALLVALTSGVDASVSHLVAFGIPVEPSRLVVGTMILAIVGALPIAVAGLGTGQIAAVYVFQGVAPPETLVTLSLLLSAGLIALRAGMGALFAREFTREALEQTRREAA